MVHRPADSRLLTNLLKQEKDYSNSLNSTLDQCQTSLNALEAYAAASTPPTSNVIVDVAGYISNAEGALRKYAAAIDGWRVRLEGLRELEDEVATIMRDREILVGRLIKASKTKQKDRDASPEPNGRQHNPKMNDAQAELQGCEAHLASKERELDMARINVLREGLNMRCRAMIECGWTWGEMGKEACSALDSLDTNGYGFSSPLFKPLPRRTSHDMGSDISSILPSQSASQLALPNSYMDASGSGYASPRSRLQLAPPHSISDHDIPIRREVPQAPPSSSSEEGDVEVHENPVFANRRLSRGSQLRFASPTRGSRSELGTEATASKKQRGKKKRDGFLGGIAALFKGKKAREEDSSDEDEPVPTTSRPDYARLQRNSFKQNPSEPHLPSTTRSPSSSSKGTPRARTSSLGAPRNSANERLLLTKAPPVPNGTAKANSSLRRIENGPQSGKSMVHKKAASDVGHGNKGSSLEVISERGGSTSNLKRSGTTRSSSSGKKASRSASASAKTRSWDGLPTPRSKLADGQPSLLTVMENGSAIPGGYEYDHLAEEKEKNTLISLPPPNLKVATAPGSVFDRLVSPSPVKEHAPLPVASTSETRESRQLKATVDSHGPHLSGSILVTSPTMTNSSLHPDSPKMNGVPLKSALRVRTPSPGSSDMGSAMGDSTPKASNPPLQNAPPQKNLVPPPSSWTAQNEDDAASMNSVYETGQESLSEDDEPAEKAGPATPPKSPGQQRAASSKTAGQVPASGTTPHSGEDTISNGSGSTATGLPARRKSVRMSLEPTFSPTPPAMEDSPLSPWSPAATGSRRIRTSRDEPDPWQDSSDDSDDYSRARKALTKADKKLKRAGKTTKAVA